MDRLEHALKYIRKPKLARTGFVYFIQCHYFTKVGFTDKVSIRLSALQTGCPYELKLLKSIPSKDMEIDEERVHKHWKRYEIRGEWFQLPEGFDVLIAGSDTINELLES